MTTVCPAPPAPVVTRPPVKRRPPPAGSWRYAPEHTTRLTFAAAMLVSAALHAGLLFGIGSPKKKPRPVAKDDLIQLTITPPNLKDLEEPEPAPNPDDQPPPDPGTLVPMQQDVPQIARPSDFVQAIDFSSLLPPPDYTQAKIFTIPENIGRGGKLGAGMVIFNIADLDRIPEPIYQPAPIFPPQLKREVETATVKVEFIVDTDGRVVNAFVVDTTHPGFNEAAVAGVSKWRFRAGFKNGRKVNTRMQVPIIFRLVSDGV